MFTAGDSTAPVWALAAAFLALVGVVWKQRRDEKMDKRIHSGNVSATPGEVIFEAAEHLRHEMRDQIDRLLTELDELQGRARQLRVRVIELEDENEELRNRLRIEVAKNAR